MVEQQPKQNSGLDPGANESMEHGSSASNASADAFQTNVQPASQPGVGKSAASIFLNYRTNLDAIVFSPMRFFALLPQASGFKAPLLFFTISLAIDSVILTIFRGMTEGLIHLVMGVGLSFLTAFAVNRIAKLLGAKEDFKGAYQVIGYSGVVFLTAWISWLSALWLLYVGFLCYLGFRKVFVLTKPKSIALAAAATAILSIAF